MNKERNFILGAGLSGLAAAHLLKMNLTKPYILEATNNIGGRISTIKHTRVSIDIGAQFFSKKDLNLYPLIKDLSLDKSLTETSIDNLDLMLDSKLIKINDTKYKDFDKTQSKELEKFRLSLLNCNKNPISMNSELFLINFQEWYYQNIGKETIWFPDALLKSITFTDSKKVCAFYGILACQSFFIKTHTFHQGMSALINKLKKDINIENSKITNISFSKESVGSITESTGKIIKVKKGLISAIPSNELYKIVEEKCLAKALKKIPYNGCSVLVIEPKNKMLINSKGILTPESKIISAILNTGKYCTILAPYDNKKGEAKKEKILKEFDKLSLDFDKKLIYYKNWDYGLPEFNKKTYKLQKDIQYLTNNYSNFAICGDFMGLPSLDACVESGYNAAKKLMQLD